MKENNYINISRITAIYNKNIANCINLKKTKEII